MDDRYCSGYRVTVKSSRHGSGWRTDVAVFALGSDPSEAAIPVPVPAQRWPAATEQEADQYGFEVAKEWIARARE